MKRNDAEPQRESRSVEDKKKLTKVVFFFKREREEYCLQKSRLAPSFEERRREIESERERERELIESITVDPVERAESVSV